jgi:hypothetical protein
MPEFYTFFEEGRPMPAPYATLVGTTPLQLDADGNPTGGIAFTTLEGLAAILLATTEATLTNSRYASFCKVRVPRRLSDGGPNPCHLVPQKNAGLAGALTVDGPMVPLSALPVWTDRDFCAAAIAADPFNLQNCDASALTTHMCNQAVVRNGKTLEWVPAYLLTRQMCLAAVTTHGQALQWVPLQMQSEAVIGRALLSDGMAIRHIHHAVERTYRHWLVAVRQNSWAFVNCPLAFQTDQLVTTALSSNGCLLKYVVYPTEAHLASAVKENGMAIEYVPRHRRTPVMEETAMDSNMLAALFV